MAKTGAIAKLTAMAKERSSAKSSKKYADGGGVSRAAQIDGNDFVLAAQKHGLGQDTATLNKMVALVNRGATVDQAARAVAQGGKERNLQAGGIAKLAQSGAMDKLAKLLRGTQETLPAAEREANKAKFLAESKTPMRLYHGTTATEGKKGQEAIKRIKPSKEGSLGSGVYLTPRPAQASNYTGVPNEEGLAIMAANKYHQGLAEKLSDDISKGVMHEGQEGGNMLPVYAQIKNPLIIEGKGDPMIEALVKLGIDQDAAARMVERAYENKGYIGKEVESRARAAGYDGLMQYRDGDLSEVVSYNPNAVKSAIGNKGTYDTNKPDLNEAGGGLIKGLKALKGAQKADDAAKTSLGEVGSMVSKMGEEGRSPIVPVPNRWFLYPDKFPHQQKMVERVLATTGKKREDFPSGAFIDPRTGEVLDSRIMNELGVVIDPKTNRPMMSAKGESGIERIDPKLGAFTKSNLVRKGLFKPEGGDPLLNDLNFLATIEKGDVGHKYGLATEYASPAELWNTGTGANPTLRPRSRGDLFGVGDVVGQVRVGRSEPHDVYEKLFVAPKGSDVPGVKLSKAKGGEVHMKKGGDPVDPRFRTAGGDHLDEFVPPRYRSAGRRPESQQDREASANIPVAVARGLVSGALGMPGDIESLVRIPYDYLRSPTMSELVTGDKTSKTILPTSEDIEKRLPFRGASQTPVGEMFTGAGQLAGGFYTGPGSGARAVMAVPKAVKRAGQDFAMAAGQSGPKIFIGPKAKTWDQAKADAAARMEQEGRDPVDIWRQTGTFRGADGIMRQEISDVGAIYRNPKDLKELGKQKRQEALDLGMRMITPIGQKDFWPKALTEAKKPVREEIKRLKSEADELGRFSDVRGQSAKFVLEHPELYKAYPELGNVTVFQGYRGLGNESASLRGGKNDMQVDITQKGLRGNPRSSMLHEMQHAVQTLEDMAPGGSPSMAFQDPAAFKILEDLRAKASTPMSFEDYAERYSHLANKEAGYQDYLKSIPGIVKNMDRELQSQAAMEYYKRLAGEAEARATQMREPMSASQRAQEFPYSSYDVLPEDLIVKPAKGTVNALQTVYHGSPHKFDRFDASKIGTGEGAQSYGHGLYLAESPGVAGSYQRKLSESLNPLIDGAELDSKNPAHIAAVIMHDNNKIWPGMTDQARESALYTLRSSMVHPDNKDVWGAAAKIIERGESLPKVQEKTGHFYTVDLPDEKIARMLDWDKPLSQQPEVIKALKGTDYEVGMSQREAEKVADMRLRQEADEWAEMTGGDPVDYINNADWEKYVDRVRRESGSIDSSITGADLHRMVMRDEGYRPELFDPENYQIGTSEALRGYGIPGIRYLDASSRDAGKGTSNFVVFPGEEDALTILERKKEGGEVKMAEGGAVGCGCNDEPKMQAGGAAKTLRNLLKPRRTEEPSLPLDLPRAPAKTREEIRPAAQRMAEQMTGEFVRPNPKKSINPAKKSRVQFEMERGLTHDIRPTPGGILLPQQVADIEKQKGMLKIGVSGDTTIADKSLYRAGPYQLDMPSPQHGGPLYALGGEGAWASNNPVAATFQKRVQELSQAHGEAPVLGQFLAMGPQGSNFALHFADANLRAIDPSKMSKQQVEMFNNLIREGSEKSGPRPSFPGIEDKDSAYLHFAFDAELRKHFNAMMQKPDYTSKLGLPDGRVILHAITEPELRNTEVLTSGLSQMRLDPSVNPADLALSVHPTYSHVIPKVPGSDISRTKYPMAAEIEFPDVAQFVRQNYKPKEFTRVYQTATPRQIVDQQHIDEIKMYEELMKQYTGKKKGGKIGPLSAVEKV